MNKKSITALAVLLISGGVFMTGCSVGNVTVSDNSRKAETPKEKKADKARAKKKAAKQKVENAKQKQRARGKEYKYALPKGPSWMYIYDNGKKTSVNIDPNEIHIAKLHEFDKVKFGGSLPVVGELMTEEYSVGTSSDRSTMDESDSYDKKLSFSKTNTKNEMNMSFYNLKNADDKEISQMAFNDLPKYLDAASTNDSSKLPNQSKLLISSLDGTNYRGDSAASFQVMNQYYDKKSSKHSSGGFFDGDHATYVQIGSRPTMELKNATLLFVQTYAKVKKTDTDQHAFRTDDDADYGSSSTQMEEYQMAYQLTDDNKWQLVSVVGEGESPYSMDTSKSNWIVQKN